MKNFKAIISAIACVGMVASAVPTVASAEDENLIYGTMNIPYADFYKAELSGSVNEYEVDAVSSATTTGKWAKNGEGELFEGTYNQPNEDGTGTILGVTYPVALTSETLAELGDNNYGFVETSEVPTAYKTVSLEDGVVTFSSVNGATTSFSSDVSISTSTAWGDYVVDVANTPDDLGAIYGAVLTTASDEKYGLRHLENIWRGEFAWSVGFTTQEPHGNTLSYEDYQGLMGDTITQITYITKNGYYTLDTSVYVPVKFEGSVEVSDASITDGKATISTVGIPSDYVIEYSVDGLDSQIVGDTITFSNATPASYTLSVKDANGVYMGLSTTFELTTDTTPVTFDGTKLAKADGSSDEDFANYIKNIQSVTVNGTSYSASGKGAVTIVKEDGTIDTTASSRNGEVFSGADSYTISITSAGYTNDFEFTLGGTPEVTTTTNAPATTTTTTNKTSSSTDDGKTVTTTTTANDGKTVTTTTTSKKDTSSPATGSKSMAVPVAMLSLATVAMGVFKKKHRD
jgi:hypothetical protein